MNIDILITTAGAWPYPQKCIESILRKVTPGYGGLPHESRKLPDGIRLLIRDNPASKRDETFNYLVSIAKEFGPERVLLFSPDWSGEHGHNLDFLVTKTTAEWALAIDSDVEFTDPNWLSTIKTFIGEYPDMQCGVEIAMANKAHDYAYLPMRGDVPRRWIPRATSYFMLFKPEWIREQGISFGRNDFEASCQFQDIYPYPLPNFIRMTGHQRWTGDLGWQLLWAGANCNEEKPYSLVQIPPKVRNSYTHHVHKICNFMHRNDEKPNAPTNRAHWGESIPQYIP